MARGLTVFAGRTSSHDCGGDAALYGAADGREDSDTPHRPHSDAYGAGYSSWRNTGSGTGDSRVLSACVGG